MAEKHEQVKPLAFSAAFSSPSTSIDEEGASQWRSSQYLRKRRGLIFCCGCCAVVVVVLGVVALVLALTVFRVKDPELTMNAILLDSVLPGAGTADYRESVNVTLTADVSVKNPNVASFKFRNSTIQFYYGGEMVGVAYAPGGMVSADRTTRTNVTAVVMMDRVAKVESLAGNVMRGSVNLTSYTEIGGRVNLFGVFRQELDAFLNCSMTVELSLAGKDVKNRVCRVQTR